MARISEILLEQGRQQAGYRQRRGQILGGLVQGLGQIPGQILADRQAAAAQRAAAERQAMQDARQARGDERADAQLGIALSAEQRQIDAATAGQEQAAATKSAEQRGKEQVQAWVKQHGHKLQPQEAEGILAAIELPGGVQKAIEVLTRAPEGMKLQSIDPTRPVMDMNTGDIVREGTPEPERPDARAAQIQLADAIKRGDMATANAIRQAMRESEMLGRAPVAAGGSDNEPLVAVIGDDGQPVLMPRSKAAGRRPASNREQGRPVISGDANAISDLNSGLADLKELRGEVATVGGSTGTKAAIGAALPNWVTESTGIGATAKSKQAVIDRVKQVIGKALEGGVLRKEDEIKYAKILPTIGDVPSVVKTKLDGLEKAIERKRQTLLDSLGDAGYDVSSYNERGAAQTAKKIGRFEVEVSD